MSAVSLGPEVASRVEALVGALFRPLSDDALADRTGDDGKGHGQLSLATRFAIAAAIILFNGMALMGTWVSGRIENGVVHNAAAQLALQMEDRLPLLADEIEAAPGGSPALQTTLDTFVGETAAGGQIDAVKIWRPDGTILSASGGVPSRRKVPMYKELSTALAGTVDGVYNAIPVDLSGEKSGAAHKPFLDIYVPMRAAGSGRIVAAAEFSQDARHLESVLTAARHKTWLVAGGLTFVMFSLLYAIVRGGNRLIEQQRRALETRIAEQDRLNRQNTALRHQLQLANRRGTELNERFLRRVSSDLHDGPAQHLALALLRLDELVPIVNASSKAGVSGDSGALATIRRATADALKEIRNISSGLALPELQKISPADALNIAARAHERATATQVAVSLNSLPQRLPLPMTICLFRFAQEGLNNAFRHAQGKGQRLVASFDGSTGLQVQVFDSGPGFLVEQRLGQSERIGLAGLRHRVESLGGMLHIHSIPGDGTRLTLHFLNIAADQQNG